MDFMKDTLAEPQEHDESYSSDDGSTSTDNDRSASKTSSTPKLDDEDSMEVDRNRRKAIIEREEGHVRRVRMALMCAILVCTVAVSVSVYHMGRKIEHHRFDSEFDFFILSLIDHVQWENNFNFALLQQLSSHISSIAEVTGTVFPNVTVPHFEIEAGYVNGLSGIIACAYAPIIMNNERTKWENYSLFNKGWINESFILRENHPEHLNPLKGTRDGEELHETTFQESHGDGAMHGDLLEKQNILGSIHYWVNGSITIVPEANDSSILYAPIWQITPPVPMAINSDLFSSQLFVDLYNEMISSNQTVISTPAPVDYVFDFLFDEDHITMKLEPYSFMLEPVYSSFNNSDVVGIVIGLVPFEKFFDFLLPSDSSDVIAVITDSCGIVLSYEIQGPNVTFLGYQDFHDPTFDYLKHSAPLHFNRSFHCEIKMYLYPTKEFEQSYATSTPVIYTCMVILAFTITSLLMIFYDFTVTRRQEKTMKSALMNGALVESLFPAIVRDRLLEDARNAVEAKFLNKKCSDDEKINTAIKRGFQTRPIAEFFPSTTLMFADISGFTAWSSTREPFQVFELLETIYGEFDAIAKRRGIFKVETVGDCYVAVCGVPNARVDHAVAMAKFARDCLAKMKKLVKVLEVSLGPDTSSLAFRVGLHSGPVTGGVLRGDNARFQLFGDTVNTTARMESTGIPNRIQISQSTATLLIEASKDHWIKPREEVVNAKGKGEMRTFWLTVVDSRSSARRSTSSQGTDLTGSDNLSSCVNSFGLDDKTQRVASWISEVLLRFLKLIVERRGNGVGEDQNEDWFNVVIPEVAVVDEVVEIITLPNFKRITRKESSTTKISDEVEAQLLEFVQSVASLYRNNYFHNFDHASHVTMSVVKLLGRIVPVSNSNAPNDNQEAALALHDHTFGITSDPLTQFACLFAALIHDVDHLGVSNAQLVQEEDPIAKLYDGKSVLEQNSVVLAWNLLLEARFKELRMTICATRVEAKRFRQLVVNAVMATDIMAADLKAIRNRRWNLAFSDTPLDENQCVTTNRKATIVIDHLIQASDVCHTMQHWHIYRKWNECLFMEMSKAYYEGRGATNPADTWYKGEIGFFDFYIIPLAKKLDNCGVFGVSSDEYLNYAIKNRDEWEARGEEVVAEMSNKIKDHPDFQTYF